MKKADTKRAKAPMQPFVLTGPRGRTVRFRANALVDCLLDEAQKRGFGLNELMRLDFPQSDLEQFHQLIGYSLAGYHELPCVSDQSAVMASRAARRQFPSMEGLGGCRDDGCKMHIGVGVERDDHK